MSTGNPDVYTLDPAELDDVVRDLETCERELETMTNDLERQIARLHEQWEGLAATAQREAHEEWELGLQAMRASLAQMRAAGRIAHDNYGKAVAANVAMWGEIR